MLSTSGLPAGGGTAAVTHLHGTDKGGEQRSPGGGNFEKRSSGLDEQPKGGGLSLPSASPVRRISAPPPNSLTKEQMEFAWPLQEPLQPLPPIGEPTGRPQNGRSLAGDTLGTPKNGTPKNVNNNVPSRRPSVCPALRRASTGTFGKVGAAAKRKGQERWFQVFGTLLGMNQSAGHGVCINQKLEEQLWESALLAAKIEEATVDLYTKAKEAGLDLSEIAKIFREQIFGAHSYVTIINKSNNPQRGGMGAYAYKHIVGHPAQEYDLDVQIGAGAFGVVRKARHRRTAENHAVKSVPKSTADDAMLFSEIEIMRHLDHPHVMRLYNTFEDETHVYMAFELCTGGSFFELLAQRGFLTESLAARVFRQILGVVSYLHGRSICHRDLKPENFLVSRKTEDLLSLQMKLIDFGTAKRFDLENLVTKVCTPHYVAPEVLKKGAEPYSEKVDVWSCGIVLFQMLSGNMPFHRDSELQLLRAVRKGLFEFQPESLWSLVSESAQNLVSSCLAVDAGERFSADKAFHHEWIHARQVEEDVSLNDKLMKQMHTFLTNNRLKRVALRIIASQIKDESIDALRGIFLTMDGDNSGSIKRSEMEEAVKRLDVGVMARAGMVEIMCQLDPTGSGSVEYTEFLAATMSKEQYLREDVCKSAFVRLDGDGDGVITRRDLGRLLADREGVRDAGLEGATIAELTSELDAMLRNSDADHDGGINFEEFMELMADENSHFATSAVASRRGRGRKSYSAKDFSRLDDVLRMSSCDDLGEFMDSDDESDDDE